MGRKGREVCRLGPYSLSRNPLYLFSFVGLVGVTLGAENILLAFVIAPLYWAYYAFVIAAEEAELRGKFPEAFEAYRREVPRLVPRWRRPDVEDVSPRDARALFRAVLDAQVFMWLLVLLEILEFVKLRDVGGHLLPIWILPF